MRQLSKISIFRVLLIFFISLSISSHSQAQTDTSMYSPSQNETDETDNYAPEEEETSEDDTYSSTQNEESAPNQYWSEDIKVKKFDEKKWKSITKDLNYTENTIPKQEEKEVEPKEERDHSDIDIPSAPIQFGPALQIFVYGLAIALLVFILLRLIGVNIFVSNKKIKSDRTISIENIEEELHESDLDKFLKQALTKKDYKLAIRIYYLIILKELSLRNFILWQKDKTNREYLNEMTGRDSYKSFTEVTRMFEKAWYGNSNINETDYLSVLPVFKGFAESLKATKV